MCFSRPNDESDARWARARLNCFTSMSFLESDSVLLHSHQPMWLSYQLVNLS
jgi:hypothetical protein